MAEYSIGKIWEVEVVPVVDLNAFIYFCGHCNTGAVSLGVLRDLFFVSPSFSFFMHSSGGCTCPRALCTYRALDSGHQKLGLKSPVLYFFPPVLVLSLIHF